MRAALLIAGILLVGAISKSEALSYTCADVRRYYAAWTAEQRASVVALMTQEQIRKARRCLAKAKGRGFWTEAR